MSNNDKHRRYWRANIRLVLILLTVWAIASFGLSIFFVEPLNKVRVGGFPLGFWFAQQGAILVFVVLIWIYARSMDRLDGQFRDEEEKR